MPNQYKSNPQLDDIKDGIVKFFEQGLTDEQIIESLKAGKYFDTDKYGLGLKKFREMREKAGCIRSRKAGLTVHDIKEDMVELRKIYPRAGLRDMKAIFSAKRGKSVRRSVLEDYFKQYKAHLVRERRSLRFRRKRFWSAGVGDVLCCDQHDKWKRFGLRLHTGVDPFPGQSHWIKVWYTNSNPILITSYFLDHVEETGYMPLVTQSDPGSENFGIAKAQTFLRHWHDNDMVGYLAHRWMKEKKNIAPEISWSQLRRRFTPGFEDILDHGVNMGYYDIGDVVHKLVFRWEFMPWIQAELDAFRNRINNSKKRRDRNKILPHGVPNHIVEFPHLYGALDFRIKVQPEAVLAARQHYAPPDHSVFKLVPDSFEAIIQQGYQSMGSPVITRQVVWDVYLQLVDYVYAYLEGNSQEELCDDWVCEIELTECNEVVDFELDQLQPLADIGEREDGSFYSGGVNHGAGIDHTHDAALNAMLDEDEPHLEDDGGQFWTEGSAPLCVIFSEDEEGHSSNEE